jgi:methyl-accepting chemotaxis protein
MKNLKIGLRLGLGFAGMVLLISLIAVHSYMSSATIYEQVSKLTSSNTPKVVTTFEIQRSVLSIMRSTAMIVAVDDDAFRAKEKAAIEAERAAYRENLGKLEKLESYPEGKVLIEKLKVNIAALAEVDERAITLAMEKKQQEADTVLKSQIPPLVSVLSAIGKDMVDFQTKRSEIRAGEAGKAFRTSQIALAVAWTVSVLAAVALGVLITRSITAPLGKMRDMLQDIAQGEGDLTKRLDDSTKDELGEANHWFNVFVEKLHRVVSEIAESSVQVASASSQLCATAEQIASGAEEVAGQTATVGTASEEMAATSGDIARNCHLAADTSKLASETAHSGVSVVRTTIDGMDRIAKQVRAAAKTVEELGARSDQIGAIVGTIEDIADQTNLLALNAAIEAARAGEQGRGFAVVADEVRALAERTTRATSEISEMIKAIQHETRGAVSAMEEGVAEVEKGTASSVKSGEALESILSQINDVSMQVNQIATAAEQQTATTSEITSNIHQITQVVHATSRGASDTASASSDLSRESEQLQRLAKQFKLA